MTHIVFLGIQGSGKSVQAGNLLKHFPSCVRLQMGTELRILSQQDTILGKKVHQLIANGDLADDEVIADILENFVQKNADNHIVLDGMPRSIEQKKILDKLLSEYIVVHLVLPQEVAIARISGRLVDPMTHEIFTRDSGLTHNPKTGNELIVREDDKPEAVAHRFEIYYHDTLPILEAFKKDGHTIFSIDASGSIDEVEEKIIQAIAPSFS